VIDHSGNDVLKNDTMGIGQLVLLGVLLYGIAECIQVRQFQTACKVYRHSPLYLPLAVHWLLRFLSTLSRLVLPWMVTPVAKGLYLTHCPPGPVDAAPVLFIGPLASPNTLFPCVPGIVRYLQTTYPGSPVYIYLPEACRLGRGYSLGHAVDSVSDVQSLLRTHLPQPLHSVHLVGQSFGSCIVRALRLADPARGDTRTELWDPVFPVPTTAMLARLLDGRFPLYPGGVVPSVTTRLLYSLLLSDPSVWRVLCDARDQADHPLWQLGRYPLENARCVLSDNDHLLPPHPTPVPTTWTILSNAGHAAVLLRLRELAVHSPSSPPATT
jgi:hypothetical protein